jgi:hypothetical protein
MIDQNEFRSAQNDVEIDTHYCRWEDDNWNTLIYSIKQGDCILMLGPDASVTEVNGTYRPLTEILANELSEKISQGIKEHIDTSNLAQVSQYYSNEPGKQDLQARVNMFYQEKKGLTSNLHQDLAALPFYFTITTTFDSLFINALSQENKKPIMGWYNFKKNQQDKVKIKDSENPLVFYLFGNIQHPKSLLLSESDLLDFMVALISRRPKLQYNIQYELQKEDKSFLFLGFGFRHWYLRILLHVLLQLKKYKKDSRSFAMEQFIPENISELRETVFFFKQNDYKIHIFKQDFKQFARELRQRFDQFTPQCVSMVEKKNAPKVFICHASENKEYAAKLSEELETAGLNPWLDKVNLRGGDEWKSCIGKKIKEVDYFVVLLSKSLNNRRESYVYWEIDQALERKKCLRSGERFIIPVKIEECDSIEELEKFQNIDLTGKIDIKDLKNTVKRDFEKRKKQ